MNVLLLLVRKRLLNLTRSVVPGMHTIFFFVKKSSIFAGAHILDFSFLNQDFGNLSLIALTKFVHIN